MLLYIVVITLPFLHTVKPSNLLSDTRTSPVEIEETCHSFPMAAILVNF